MEVKLKYYSIRNYAFRWEKLFLQKYIDRS